ncbi:MAG: bifunctional phosphoribosyl-AMP cyclohydrolase/phosphoribosyl-ATP diphosphatase HisIE [Bacteroidetes bacterium]|nr:bifunctional phosphoribosyl-AMP cyclohydrolase/phosphoribosyl-ATP diphosphatase HisIE [Bacteroidota bacterium]MDA1119829.1 bifunctional phosphoribosyl-AMP cyclohydrolase/phosphoribosyl-ATP diphosphatase HisIE [Bacteroidota bacterium]
MALSNLDFSKNDGLIPAIIQDYQTGKVLMLGYMNEEAIQKTEESGLVTFYSRSKNRLWTKGETSGNHLELKEMIADCDKDTLLIKAEPKGPTCHTGQDTCFGEKNQSDLAFLSVLEDIIQDRKINPAEGSYTTALFKDGINKIAQKVGEEAVEVVIEAKDDNEGLFKNEVADLLFHTLILLREKDVQLSDIVEILEERHQK